MSENLNSLLLTEGHKQGETVWRALFEKFLFTKQIGTEVQAVEKNHEELVGGMGKSTKKCNNMHIYCLGFTLLYLEGNMWG